MKPSNLDLRIHQWIARARSNLPRTVGVIAASVVVIVALVATYTIILDSARSEIDRPSATVPQQSEPVTQSRLGQVRELYGPWKIVASNTASDHVVLVKSNGTLELGSRVIRPDSKWRPAVATSIKASERHKQNVRVLMVNSTVFTVSVNQAFIIETQPERLFAFNDEGKIVSKPTPTN